MFYLYINLSIHQIVNMLWLLSITIHEVCYIYIHILNMSLTHVYIQIYLSTYLICLSMYPFIFINLCLYFYKVLFICMRNKIIISYAYLDDPDYKFRQFYVNNGKMKTKYGNFIVQLFTSFSLNLALVFSECHIMVITRFYKTFLTTFESKITHLK